MNNNLSSLAKGFAVTSHVAAGCLYNGQAYGVHLQMVVDVAKEFINLLPVDSWEDILAACWCHDLIEDAHLSFHDIVEVIGKSAANIVYAVTDELGRNRKERAFKTYLKIMVDPLALFVKLCDRIANTEYSCKNGNPQCDMYRNEYHSFINALASGPMIRLYKPMWDRLRKISTGVKPK